MDGRRRIGLSRNRHCDYDGQTYGSLHKNAVDKRNPRQPMSPALNGSDIFAPPAASSDEESDIDNGKADSELPQRKTATRHLRTTSSASATNTRRSSVPIASKRRHDGMAGNEEQPQPLFDTGNKRCRKDKGYMAGRRTTQLMLHSSGAGKDSSPEPTDANSKANSWTESDMVSGTSFKTMATFRPSLTLPEHTLRPGRTRPLEFQTPPGEPEQTPQTTHQSAPFQTPPEELSMQPAARLLGGSFIAPLSAKEETLVSPSSSVSAPLSPPNDSGDLNPTAQLETSPATSPVDLPCPYCNALVPKSALATFRSQWRYESAPGSGDGRRFDMRGKEHFCRYHNKLSAARAWREASYPELSKLFKDLRRRSQRQLPYLLNVVNGEVPSTYLKLYREELASARGKRRPLGTDRTSGNDLRFSSSRVQLGYFGSKGEKIFTDVASMKLREEVDTLVSEDVRLHGSTKGAAHVIHEVLVPEMALRCCMEDFQCGEERAREILKDSAGLGETLCEEDGEVSTPGAEERDDGLKDWR